MIEKFHGVVPAMATPFTPDFEVDEATFRSLIDWYIEQGVHGISVAGSQGEFFALDHQERIRLTELSVEAIGGRVPLYMGTGGISTREAITYTRVAESAGADLALVITPYFISPNGEELVEHFSQIAKATKLPVMLYNNPPRTGTNVTPEIYTRCAQIDNVVGIKDSSGDITQVVEYVLAGGAEKVVFAGRDTIIMSLVMHGGAGAISPAANVFPSLVVDLYDAIKAGRMAEALEISNALAPLRAAWAWASFPVVIKEAMDVMGRRAGPARPPISGLSPDRRAQLKVLLERIQDFADQRSTLPAAVAAE